MTKNIPQFLPKAFTKIFTLVALLGLLNSCISVSLSPKITKSERVSFKAPPLPFESISSPEADQAWQDRKAGNLISFLTACKDQADPSLETIEKDLLSSVDSIKILKSESEFFDGRESHKTLAQGTVDGIPTKIQILVFKKNNCSYSLSYVGVEKSFDQDLPIFNKFLESFKAP
jgi:hypothetical protein